MNAEDGYLRILFLLWYKGIPLKNSQGVKSADRDAFFFAAVNIRIQGENDQIPFHTPGKVCSRCPRMFHSLKADGIKNRSYNLSRN